MNTTLLIMAAGIGSRFGTGIKQLEPVDDANHIIMDYSIHDAIEAGFKCRTKSNNSKRKNLSRALFQGRCGQQQNRQKIFCTARDLRQAWCQPSLKMFMCMRVGVS